MIGKRWMNELDCVVASALWRIIVNVGDVDMVYVRGKGGVGS